MKVKICGITRVIDARHAADLGADAIGLNFWQPSKRFVSHARAKQVVRALPPLVWAVGVFVNAPRGEILEAISSVGLHAIQLHGDETARDTRGYPVPVFKAVRVKGKRQSFAKFGDVPLVLDAAQPGYGGGGVTFDWALAKAVARKHDVILAGGLKPSNVREAIDAVKPFGVDVASGVESSPGIKEKTLMSEFIRAAKGIR